MNITRIRTTAAAILLTLLFNAVAAPAVAGKKNEYDAVCDHIEERYEAKKVKIPFMWLARAAVGIVKPAGVRSFKVTIYRELKFSRESLDTEMRSIMSEAFSKEWSPILRVITRDGEQIYMNMREHKKNVKVFLVSINRDEAVVVRAKFDPDKLVEFLDDPKVFGVSLDGK
ncbi:MAG: hypothetical protein DWQ47_15115 [Acidobacteria bacterium]|nr:MAG: hypothetical protein DWQ32_02515 [Acidobacteriota bacterium]REK02606.1 MAG: hypothetical protein DWQ38_09620 [Acidobacteriota bacterium]REK13591.1 MAG: hypothetical protein DWQ43_08205 [Acidobacteriota bacterium]REK41585.1 MAG: hypothetical protein DWQ47_15115 [Acidobacteriota bacterium]